ncbi:MAG: hypothetical protein ABI665_25705 [Vicinamibacterales bacterium]
MTITTHVRSAVLAALAAATMVACEAGMPSPTSPSAVVGSGGAVNADGSTMKVSSPNAVFPLADAIAIPVEAVLTAQPARGRYLVTTLSHRFQVSDTDTFENLLSNGSGESDSQGLVRYNTEKLPAAKKMFWRVRAEENDHTGPWSNVMAFTTAGAPTTPPPTTPTGGGPRPADPPAGVRLPLPEAMLQAVLAQFSNASDSCPRGLKYVNNPWQDRVIDAMRQKDTRVGYNAKPTRTAADNNGVAVIAAGDEMAYHYSAGPDAGSTEVHLVDMLQSHCGSPAITWRVFTGEEPGRWTSAGRF